MKSPFRLPPSAFCTWRLRFGSREIGTNFCWDRYIATPVRPVRDE